jgi:hypothetical protein
MLVYMTTIESSPNGIVTIPIDAEIKDFTRARKRIQFKIDDDIFDAYPALPALILMEFSARAEAVNSDDNEVAKEELIKMFELILQPESLKVFIERMRNYEKPIDNRQVNDVIPWLLEQYGLRPTTPSENSSDGQPNQDSGTNSTASTPDVASTSDTSN